MESYRVVGRRDPHIFQGSTPTDGGDFVSFKCRSTPLYPQENDRLIYVRGWVDPRAVMWLQGLREMQVASTSYAPERECILVLGITWRRAVSFTSRSRYPGTQWIGGSVDPRAGVDDPERIKILLLPGPKPRPAGYRHSQRGRSR
jgi:hypothetical protein